MEWGVWETFLSPDGSHPYTHLVKKKKKKNKATSFLTLYTIVYSMHIQMYSEPLMSNFNLFHISSKIG